MAVLPMVRGMSLLLAGLTRERELDSANEASRIDVCQQIVLNEAFRVARLARLDKKVVP